MDRQITLKKNNENMYFFVCGIYIQLFNRLLKIREYLSSRILVYWLQIKNLIVSIYLDKFPYNSIHWGWTTTTLTYIYVWIVFF